MKQLPKFKNIGFKLMIKFLNNIDTIISSFPVKRKYKSSKHYLDNNLCFNITGNLEKSDKIFICFHGLGGTKEAAYINSLTNSLMDEFNCCVIAPDMPGVGDSVKTNFFWGIQKNLADVYIDNIIDFIISKNSIKNKQIFLIGHSGSCGSVLAYLLDNENTVSNKNLQNITYSYLISPGGSYLNSLIWIRDNSVFSSFVSLCFSYQKFKFLLRNKKFDYLKNISKDRIFDIVLSNLWVNGNSEYKHNFQKDIKNCDVFLSINDPVTNYDIVADFLKKFPNINVVKNKFGGHVGFYNPLSSIRFHEKYIIESVKAQIT